MASNSAISSSVRSIIVRFAELDNKIEQMKGDIMQCLQKIRSFVTDFGTTSVKRIRNRTGKTLEMIYL
jgi:hypothetical protein